MLEARSNEDQTEGTPTKNVRKIKREPNKKCQRKPNSQITKKSQAKGFKIPNNYISIKKHTQKKTKPRRSTGLLTPPKKRTKPHRPHRQAVSHLRDASGLCESGALGKRRRAVCWAVGCGRFFSKGKMRKKTFER